ncbi:RHS repeat domain-containing protein [Desulfovibrio sp. JC010]|uniref:RHS repeat domain-containing protein n=1 Tax=Desulfovibrio sp. JC010 TaxID=2593641 RepID=UPI0013D27C23|nr:RHS repeat-associated core domain-containing protein [Desulfovibrio sp. JC010]NDV25599.1 RHS repeat-associated core domain-containing protein [Desulfovibrio sp. JC010]
MHSERIHYEYDDKLRLLQAGDTTYTYNAYGSLAEKKVKNRITKYEYLSNGQLHKVVLPDGRIIEYVCDKRGVRIAKKINGEVVEKYKWKDFKTLESITDGTGKNKITFTRDEESGQIVMTSEGKMFYLAVDQVGSVFMVADDQGNELKRIIYDSFGNILVDTNERFYLPLGFASGLTDKDTGLVHFSFREYDPEIGRFTAQDPLGYGGGDVDVYGYCLDDPINFHDPLGLEAGGIWGTMPHRHNVKMWYIWKAREGACKDCLAKNNNVFETPTMERPHPNCRCEQVECQTWDEFTKWEETKRLGNGPATMSQPVFPPGATTVGVTWRRKIRVEESRTVKHFRMMEGNIELLYSNFETRTITKTEVRGGTAHRANSNYGVENGDSWWATNPWTGQTIGGGYDS